MNPFPGYPGSTFNTLGNAGDTRRNRNEHSQFTHLAPAPLPPSYDDYPYFLPGEGITRQVIQTELPRYLGNNSYCKPGKDNTGRVEGFRYIGFRELTDAQIRTIKEDSTRFNDELGQYRHLTGGRHNLDYVNSTTFKSRQLVETRPMAPTATEPTIPRHLVPAQEPRYLFMPLPDNRPWYDNWTRSYVHPFRAPGALSPPPPETPRFVPPSEPVPTSPPARPEIPLDPATNSPMLGYLELTRDGRWVFRLTESEDTTRPTQTLPVEENPQRNAQS